MDCTLLILRSTPARFETGGSTVQGWLWAQRLSLASNALPLLELGQLYADTTAPACRKLSDYVEVKHALAKHSMRGAPVRRCGMLTPPRNRG